MIHTLYVQRNVRIAFWDKYALTQFLIIDTARGFVKKNLQNSAQAYLF